MQYYHYTDVHAVHSIIKNQKLWLTDLRYMNDSSELSDGLRHLREALERRVSATPRVTNNAVLAAELLLLKLSDFERNIRFEEPLFALSLSSTDDLLSQWRAYGGYSIRITEEWLDQEELQISPCLYDPIKKKFAAEGAVTHAIEVVAHDIGVNSGGLGITTLDMVSELIDLAATFKNDGFQEEGEGRIIVKAESHRVQFRPRGSLLIPYVEVEIPLDAITGVRVGPIRDSELSMASMIMFAERIERDYVNNGGSIEYDLEIQRSAIPYRA